MQHGPGEEISIYKLEGEREVSWEHKAETITTCSSGPLINTDESTGGSSRLESALNAYIFLIPLLSSSHKNFVSRTGLYIKSITLITMFWP